MSVLHGYFLEQVARNSDRSALNIGERYWSYADVHHYALGVCHRLKFTAERDTAIAILCSKSISAYAGMLGIMMSRNIYVPLNSKFPPERNLQIIKNANCVAVIVDSASIVPALKLLPLCEHLTVLLPDIETVPATLRALDIHTYVAGLEHGELRPEVYSYSPSGCEGASLAYIIHTSGTTGKPKGVPIRHESASLCIENIHRLMPTTPNDRFTQFADLSFDFSIGEIFLCWKSGGCLYVPSATELVFPPGFVKRNAITVWSSVPTTVYSMKALDALRPGSLPSLRISYFCGEPLSTDLARTWSLAAPNSLVLNLYGPTEAAVFSTAHTFDRGHHYAHATVPLGKPFDGMYCLVVDDAGEVIEREAEVGELLLAGKQVADGYWNDDAATHAAFVTRTHGSGETTWYATGDLVSYDRRYGLLFHGRRDHQVKIGGYRVELLEVELAVMKVSDCDQVAVVPRMLSDGRCDALVAFCSRLKRPEAEVKAACAGILPQHMVPRRFIELRQFPLNTSGKTDYTYLRQLVESLLR